ncbi:phospholipase D beta 1-like [Dorcoceras hygrometricum]|uniref:Phospholipase D beta 1-like n=1 Tax=Dorcoceras hygrometricum TaxID=472368 RepID=A0A2Z7A7C0_9LAMI|nr:phospholipase D beta 1-like [Dorcoceras hygrometricum]
MQISRRDIAGYSPERRPATAAPPPQKRGGRCAPSRRARAPIGVPAPRFMRNRLRTPAAIVRQATRRSSSQASTSGVHRLHQPRDVGHRHASSRQARPARSRDEARPCLVFLSRPARKSRAFMRARGGALPHVAAADGCRRNFGLFDSENKGIRYNYGNSYDQIRKKLALIPLLGIRIHPPARQRKNIE